jgi:hypothetical protein
MRCNAFVIIFASLNKKNASIPMKKRCAGSSIPTSYSFPVEKGENGGEGTETEQFSLKTARFSSKSIDFNILHFDEFYRSC